MPLRRIAAPEAVRNLRTSGVSSWPPRTDSELNRVEPICKPRLRPKFHIRQGERVFAVGSCYVRNIEKVLVEHGFTVVTGQIEKQDADHPRFGTNILNNFGLPSTLNELRWALDPKFPFDPDTCIEETLPGQYVDLHVPPGLGPAPMDLVLARREAIAHAYRKIQTCSVILLTLGLVEVWYDSLAKVYLNYSPPKALFNRYPGRFELQVLSVSEASEILNGILDLLALNCPEKHRVLIEVSPIPLLTTHTDEDVIVATCYSKSVLRAIAGEAAARRDNVDYVPSYEAIMLSDRKITWLDNQHHVEKEVIAATAERMIVTYIDDEGTAEQIAELLAQADAAAEKQNHAEALNILKPLVQRDGVDPTIALRYAEWCEKLERYDDGVAALKRSSEPLSETALVVLTRLLLAVNRAEEALRALTPHVRRGVRTPRMAKSLTQTYRALGQMDQAVQAARQWAEISARSAEPFRKIAELHTEAGDFDAADAAYRTAMQREPGLPQIQFDYAVFLFEQGRAAEAEAVLDSVKTPTPFLAARAALIRRQHAKGGAPVRAQAVAARAEVAVAASAEPYRPLHAVSLASPFKGLVEAQPPKSTLAAPSMMTVAERKFLFGLASEHYRGKGLIIDAGAFLGGSTCSFVAGLMRNANLPAIPDELGKPIVTLEKGVVSQTMMDFFARHGVAIGELRPGDSFVDLLRANLRENSALVDLRIGDMLETGRVAGPIEILFLDVLKSAQLSLFALKNYYPKLIPGVSIVIQQDYFIDKLPYIKVHQEYFSNYFDYIGEIASSAVFRCIAPVPQDAWEAVAHRRLAAETQVALCAAAGRRSIDPAKRFLVALSEVRLLLELEGASAARARLEQIRTECADQLGLSWGGGRVVPFAQLEEMCRPAARSAVEECASR